MRNFYIDPADAENDVLACAAFLAEHINSTDGHAETISWIVERYLQKGDPDLCAQLVDELADSFSRDHLLTGIARYCAAANDDEYALQLADAVEDPRQQAAARETVAIEKAKLHQFDQAADIAETLEHADKAFAAIAYHQAESGDDETALAAIENIILPIQRARTLTEIANYKLTHEQNDAAVDFLARAEAETENVDHEEEQLDEEINIALEWHHLDDNERCFALLARASEHAEAQDTRAWRDFNLVRIAIIYLTAGNAEEAERTLDRIHDTLYFAKCLRLIAAEKRGEGNTEEALQDLTEAHTLLAAQKTGEIYDIVERNDLIRDIAVDMAVMGEYDRALNCADMIEVPNSRNQALVFLATRFAAMDKDDYVRQSIAAIRDAEARPVARISAGNAYSSAGETDKARQQYKDAHAETEDVPQISIRSENLNVLATAWHQLGEPETASAMMRENLKVIEGIADETVKVYRLVRAWDVMQELEIPLGDEKKRSLKMITAKAALV